VPMIELGRKLAKFCEDRYGQIAEVSTLERSAASRPTEK
jgi:hypothetical protein